MGQQLNEIKNRLQGISSTKKLTHATEMVATVEMQKYRALLNNFEKYSEDINDLLYQVLYRVKVEKETNLYLVDSKVNNPLHIVLSTNSGLCGSYNDEMKNYLKDNLAKNEAVVVIGNQMANFLKDNNYLVIDSYDDIEKFDQDKLKAIIDMLMSLYRNDEISSIDIIYNKYINSLKREIVKTNVLPFQIDKQYQDKEILLEPDRDSLLNEIIPFAVYGKLICTFLSNKSAEFAARKNAMNAASKNAENLESTLKLEYNKARQQAVTQEVNEIVGASEL